MLNLAQALSTDRELGQGIWCLSEGMVTRLLHRGLTVQVVPGQRLYHAGPISYHGHHLFLGHGEIQILPLEHWVTGVFLGTLTTSASVPKCERDGPFSPVFPAGGAHGHRGVP